MITTTLYARHCKVANLSVNPGDKVVFDVIEWFNEGWEFGHPVVMLGPVIGINHDHNAESMIESVCIDLCCGIHVPRIHESDLKEFAWRGWNLGTLKRRFREALNGKKFPVAGYIATTKTALFKTGSDGELLWEYA